MVLRKGVLQACCEARYGACSRKFSKSIYSERGWLLSLQSAAGVRSQATKGTRRANIVAAAPMTQDVSSLTQQQYASQSAGASQLPDGFTQNGFTQSGLSQPDYYSTQAITCLLLPLLSRLCRKQAAAIFLSFDLKMQAEILLPSYLTHKLPTPPKIIKGCCIKLNVTESCKDIIPWLAA